LHTTYIAAGDMTAQPAMPSDALTATSWYWLSSIEVDATASASAIVAFGDSITDGATSTVNANKSWPSQLAERLAANNATASIAILNEGISGNRILRDGTGTNALARFDRDVLGLPGVKWLMLLEGINDIGQYASRYRARRFGDRRQHHRRNEADDSACSCARHSSDWLHAHTVSGRYIRDGRGASHADCGEINSSARREISMRLWFDKATQDPANPLQFLAAFNNTDHLHPNDAGYKAMADAVDLKIFTGKK
jgi:lysophospholipase L1-like esterase